MNVETTNRVLSIIDASKNLIKYTPRWIRKLLSFLGQDYFDVLETAIDKYNGVV